ncbi:MAG: hypothetical protein CSA75_00110, partial [Sorangium cellulosum]
MFQLLAVSDPKARTAASQGRNLPLNQTTPNCEIVRLSPASIVGIRSVCQGTIAKQTPSLLVVLGAQSAPAMRLVRVLPPNWPEIRLVAVSSATAAPLLRAIEPH